MARFAGLGVWLVLFLGVAGCSKIKQALGAKPGDAEVKEATAATEKAASTAESASQEADEEKKREIPEEVKRLARRRRDAMMAKVPKYDRYPMLRHLVQKRYHVDLDDIFPDRNYNPDKFKSVRQVNAIIDQRVKEEAELEYPPERRQEVIKDAERMHPLYRVGDTVVIDHQRRHAVVRGKLEAIYGDYLVVDGKRILFQDLNSPHPVHFNPSAIRSRRELFVRTHYDDPKARYVKKMKQELTPKLYRLYGIVKYKNRWTSLKHVIPREIAPEVDRDETEYYSRKRREIERQIAADFRKEGLLPPKGK